MNTSLMRQACNHELFNPNTRLKSAVNILHETLNSVYVLNGEKILEAVQSHLKE